ncbi:DUF58 domain-containing protein [Natranaeroarchaeum aerophilus]|uniref:DUF58 domain-containing protein n=1 Tax=Natranaeroarchaeum aerophilus TaxID=2917711 RepID=A0AAE3FTI4_9EURY|nr:DUF58 domain-containing protein [Natranaeroarchaeum aerophilus]MCL9814845.1 DUF58 domain-containing protein [Natranaeroarchaeum aerophilus]
MKPTRRGVVVIALIVGGVYMAAEFGPRALNAVVGPALVALVVAAVQVGIADPPRVDRRLPEPGAVGTERSVELAIETDSPTSATVYDSVGKGLLATGNRATTTIGNGPLTYDLRLDERGDHEIGPLAVEITDVLGLFTRQFEFEEIDRLLVYPPTYQLDPAGSGLTVFSAVDQSYGNDEFEHLREYQRGDTLRDVDWKASAKRPDEGLVVGEFDDSSRQETVRIAVDTDAGDPDNLAAAAASIACYLLDTGFEVGLGTPTATVAPESGGEHRRSILAALARLSSGRLADETQERADLIVSAEGEDVTVRADRTTVAFDDLVTGGRTDPAGEGFRASEAGRGEFGRTATGVGAT